MNLFLLSYMLTSVNTNNLSTKINRVNINHSIEDEVRDDECVVIENTETRKGGEDNVLFPRNTINYQNGKVSCLLLEWQLCIKMLDECLVLTPCCCVFRYTEPDFLYVRSWLPCVFFSGGVTMGNIGRQLATVSTIYLTKYHIYCIRVTMGNIGRQLATVSVT